METTKVQTKKKQQIQAASYLQSTPEGAIYSNLCRNQEKCKKFECKGYHPLWAQNCCVLFMNENCIKEQCIFDHVTWLELIQKSQQYPEMRIDEYTLKPFELKKPNKDTKSAKVMQNQQKVQKQKQNIQEQHLQGVNATNFQDPSTIATNIKRQNAQLKIQDQLEDLSNNDMDDNLSNTAQNGMRYSSKHSNKSQEKRIEESLPLDLKAFKTLLIYKDEIMIDQGKLGQWFREIMQKYQDKTLGVSEQQIIDKAMQNLKKSNKKQTQQVQKKVPKSQVNQNKKDKPLCLSKQISDIQDNQQTLQEINQDLQKICSEKQSKLYAQFKGYNEALLNSQYITGNQLTKHELSILKKLKKVLFSHLRFKHLTW
eukprot:403363172